MSWIVSRMKLDGFLYYDVDYAYQFYPKKDPWNDLLVFHRKRRRHIVLSWPPRRARFQGTPTRRLDSTQGLARSIFRCRIHSMDASASEAAGLVEDLYEQIARSPRDWSRNYADYQNLRDRAGDYLNSLSSGSAP